jgi:hypothetical protein
VRGEVTRAGEQVLNSVERLGLTVATVALGLKCGSHEETMLVLRTENGLQEVFAGGRIKTRKVSKSLLARLRALFYIKRSQHRLRRDSSERAPSWGSALSTTRT